MPVKNVLMPNAGQRAARVAGKRHLHVRRGRADLKLPAGIHAGRQAADAVQLRRERIQRRVVAQAIFVDLDLAGLRQAGRRVVHLHLKRAVDRRDRQAGGIERRARIGDRRGAREARVAVRALAGRIESG